MAGDWIKVEVGTSSKAEVCRMAEMLGLDRLHCVGLLVAYWSWLDANARTEFVPNLSRKCLDDVLQCAGLSACLEAVGWAEWDESGWVMRVVNYEHHNGASAKTRAYEQRKKKIQREKVSRICPADTGTREREEKSISTSLRSVESRATRLPEDWQLPKQWGDIALTMRKDWDAGRVREVAAMFRDHWVAKPGADGRSLDWLAKWRNWVRREKSMTSPKTSQREQVASAMFGNHTGANDERDITAEAVRVG